MARLEELAPQPSPGTVRLEPGPLTEVLKNGRNRFNARFAQAKRLNRRLDPDLVMEHLARTVEPVIRAVAGHRTDRVEPVFEALFDLSLDLAGRDMLGKGSKYPAVDETWQKLFPSLAPLLAEEPGRLASSLSNAAFHLTDTLGADPAQWIGIMSRLAPAAPSLDLLLKAGQVAAWRSGMAQFRKSALEAWQTLPDDLALLALGLSPEPRQSDRRLLAQSLADPWRNPGAAPKDQKLKLGLVAVVGGFSGFGGPFAAPPEVTSADGLNYVFDQNCCWSIHADRFGATLQRFGPDLPQGAGNGARTFEIDASGTVKKAGRQTRIPALAGFASWAATDDTLAVTLPRSHKVFLVALAEEPEPNLT